MGPGRQSTFVTAALLALALAAPANAQLAPPWDGNPISRGLGPTYGEQWCAPPSAGSGESRQQGPPLALMPGEAVGCTLERFESEARAVGVPDRMSYEVIGRSVQGRPLYGVVVNAGETSQQRRDYARWRELRALMLTEPELAQARLARWGGDVKLPIVVQSNIHGNEEEGTDAIMQVVRDLVTTPRGENPAVDSLLDHAFLIVHPTINPDGRAAETRANANGFDLNRDLLVQGQPETRTGIADMLKWLPPVGLTMHGYVNPTQAQAMTKPHNPGYEYDLLLKWNQRRIDANEEALAAVGMETLRPVNDWCADADVPDDPSGLCVGGFPPGPAVAEGWDDWGPFYVAGHTSVWALDIQTIEMCNSGPGCNGRFGSKRAQYVSFYSSADFWTEHRAAILRDQVEIYRRGVADEPRVDCCSDPLIAARGFTADQHDWMVEYPEAYVIPFDGAAQRSDAEANRLVRWLLDNGVEVHRANRAFRWRGETYPKRSYVVWMDQAFRGLALTVLGAGQDISDRIARLYAPPGAWSRGLVWGADVVEIPRGDAAFGPRTRPIREPNRLRGGVPGGRADWYSVTLRGPTELRAVLDLLRRGVDARIAERSGALLFAGDRRTVKALDAAARAAGFEVERGRGPQPATNELTHAPRIAVLVESLAMNDTLWSLRRIFGDDAEFVSVADLQNAPADPLGAFDVIYNAGQNYPPPERATARARLQAFFERGGGYIATSQSANNFAFLNDAGLLDGTLAQGSQPAGGGIATWDNVGADGPLTAGYAAQDYLYLPTNVTYFTALPDGAVVDGRYPGSTDELFVAGLWRDRQDAAAGAPVIVHGETTAGSRYLALATNPFSRGDAEREWTLIGQAALWATASR